ncbi:MAG TPA: hypothetical protein VJ692_13865 [Nitrospiraceae bacterium]|nr:hypothetical protein [Nitrospiraceae bacterium]
MTRAREYELFTQRAASRITKQFGISERGSALAELIVRTTRNYEDHLLHPKYHQRKDALEKLRQALHAMEKLIAKRERALEPPLFDTLLPKLGELLSEEGLEKLTGIAVPRPSIAPITWTQQLDADEQRQLNREVQASRAGPKLLATFLREMRLAVDVSLAKIPKHKGGRPVKHGFRNVLIAVLAWDYHQFFDDRPTSSPEGQFHKLCRAVCEEMNIEEVGLSKAVAAVLKKIGFIPSTQVPLP